MKKSKYLNGPWSVRKTSSGSIEITAPDGIYSPWVVATVENDAFHEGDQPDNTMANAQLIAAAPQLLEALQKCEPYMSDLQTENFSDESVGIRYDQDLENALTSLRTAIAAATITEDPPNPADAQGDEMHANQPTSYDP